MKHVDEFTYHRIYKEGLKRLLNNCVEANDSYELHFLIKRICDNDVDEEKLGVDSIFLPKLFKYYSEMYGKLIVSMLKVLPKRKILNPKYVNKYIVNAHRLYQIFLTRAIVRLYKNSITKESSEK